ncbi:MAG: DUF4962 domain-containing protein [Chitinophagaceae bacterium]
MKIKYIARTAVFIASLMFFATNSMAQKPLDKIDYTLFDDFETGELFGWEPFPYSQDIGFDALYFTRSSPTYHNSKYALARPVKASDATELYQGFTKRLNLFTKKDSHIKAALYFQSDRNPQNLELSLGTFDGQRYMHTVQNPAANKWVELDIPSSEFLMNGKPLGAGEHIQVVTVKANYPMVYYLYTYTILMDNFSINGERQRRFTGVSPASTDFEMFDMSILNRHFFNGDMVSLITRPEEKKSLSQVKATLLDGKGKIVKDNITFKQRGDDWVNESIYRITKKDAPGQWQINLTGIEENNTELRWGFKFLMPGKHVTEHPRLYFSAAELQKKLANEKSPIATGILSKATSDTAFMKVNIDSIREGEDKTAENLIGGPYSKTSVGFNSMGLWLNPMNTLGRVIREGSFRYAFTHDSASGIMAKKALLKLCSFSKWNNNWMLERKFWTYYPVGYTLTPVAYGYDMLYDLLTAEERAFVREAIIKKGLKLFYRDMVEMNRMPSNMTNHIAVIVTGYGLAATAIYGDDTSNPYMEPFLSGILTKTKTFIDRTYYEDGSYGEPKSGYMDMATRDIVELLAVIERNFGVDYTTTTHAKDFYKYPLQAAHSNGLIQSYGDGGRSYSGFTQEHAEWFTYRTGNPFLYSFLKPYWEAGNGGYLGYLWYRDDIKPAFRDSLPESKVFNAQGMVMRSGWDDRSTVISTRVGPNSNHYHYDQGSFQVMTNGSELLTEPGIGSLGYYANLDYLIYDIQAIGHNVMLVDHDPESQVPADYDNGITALRDWPRLTHSFAGKIADASEASLAGVYKDKLDSYNRTLLFTKSGPLFLFDQVKTKASEKHIFDWLFHAPQNEGNQRSMTYSDGRLMITRPTARLTLDVLSPEITSAVIRDRYDKKFPESYISLTSKPGLSALNFLAVILPEAKPATGDYGPLPVSTRIDSAGWIGARVKQAGKTYLGFFNNTPGNAGTIEGFATDALRFTVSLDIKETIHSLYFEGSSFNGRGENIKSSTPITFAGAFDGDRTDIEIELKQAATVNLLINVKPASVLMDGISLRNWQYDAATKMLTLPVPDGRHDISIQ